MDEEALSKLGYNAAAYRPDAPKIGDSGVLDAFEKGGVQ
jgi:hypothetical protein